MTHNRLQLRGGRTQLQQARWALQGLPVEEDFPIFPVLQAFFPSLRIIPNENMRRIGEPQSVMRRIFAEFVQENKATVMESLAHQKDGDVMQEDPQERDLLTLQIYQIGSEGRLTPLGNDGQMHEPHHSDCGCQQVEGALRVKMPAKSSPSDEHVFPKLPQAFLKRGVISSLFLEGPAPVSDTASASSTLLFSLVRTCEFELAVPAEDIEALSQGVQKPVVKSEQEKGNQMPLLVKRYQRL
ncbi:hypothetical protein CERSUDRAFT_76677 [Gelatoporia subvermispora B]|uniref:Uncharacterized protein n=1 Tax=Ceriporiopsis subvermispora (strain B) TaxID=914234 RepID=M2QMT3_CERS8|nr:hypothetical protein CERSUDRAFT_76677 [Gelatoporia subvermispora B]